MSVKFVLCFLTLPKHIVGETQSCYICGKKRSTSNGTTPAEEHHGKRRGHWNWYLLSEERMVKSHENLLQQAR